VVSAAIEIRDAEVSSSGRDASRSPSCPLVISSGPALMRRRASRVSAPRPCNAREAGKMVSAIANLEWLVAFVAG